jgi:RNA recognition motif-containing protein
MQVFLLLFWTDHATLIIQNQPDKSSTETPPCSTLFLTNFGQGCTEEELEELLSKYVMCTLLIYSLSEVQAKTKIMTIAYVFALGRQPGFHLLKMRRRGGQPAAFADFTVYLPLLFTF